MSGHILKYSASCGQQEPYRDTIATKGKTPRSFSGEPGAYPHIISKVRLCQYFFDSFFGRDCHEISKLRSDRPSGGAQHVAVPPFAPFCAFRRSTRVTAWRTFRRKASRLPCPRLRELDGFNITIPHKQAIIPLLDALDPKAAESGSVNTVKNEDGTADRFHDGRRRFPPCAGKRRRRPRRKSRRARRRRRRESRCVRSGARGRTRHRGFAGTQRRSGGTSLRRPARKSAGRAGARTA